MVGVTYGFQVGIQKTDYVIFLNTEAALEMFYKRKVRMGIHNSLTVGSGLNANSMFAPVDIWSFSAGLFLSILAVDVITIIERVELNSNFYGREVSSREILGGNVSRPASTELLYKALADIEAS